MGVVPSRVAVALTVWLAVMGWGAAARAQQQQQPGPDTGVIATPSTPASPSADPAPDPAPSSPEPAVSQMRAKRQFYVPPTASADSGATSSPVASRPTSTTSEQPVSSAPAAALHRAHHAAKRKRHVTVAKKAPRQVPITILVPSIKPLLAPAGPTSSSGNGDQWRRLALAGIALLMLALASGALLTLTARMHRGRPRT